MLGIEFEDFQSYTIFRLFTALQQISCGFWHRRWVDLYGNDREEFLEFDHERIDVLMDTVTSIPEAEKIIIWAKYRYDIQQIQQRLVAQFGTDSVALFYGDVSDKNRVIIGICIRTVAIPLDLLRYDLTKNSNGTCAICGLKAQGSKYVMI